MTNIELKDYKNLRKIGKGTFSKVYLLQKINFTEQNKYKQNNKIVAKCINSKYTRYVAKEINILKKINSYNNNFIVKYIGNVMVRENMILFFENLDINLYTFYRKYNYKIKTVKYICYQLLKGLEFIHSLDIIHTDIKPENIMINEDKSIKIIDFGSYQKNTTPKNSFYISSRYYRSPEALYRLQYNEKIDIWSAICTIIELILKTPLFPAHNETELVCKINDLLGTPVIDEYKETFIYKKYFELDTKYNLPFYDSPLNNKYKYIEPFKQMSATKLDAYYLFKLFNNVLEYDLKKRYNASECLQSPLFLKYILKFNSKPSF
jgi:serine/threonine protein kinase